MRCGVASVLLWLAGANARKIPAGYSETVEIPQPSEPKSLLFRSRTDCPHLREDLLDWNDAGLTPSSPGEDVTLPENTKIVVSATIPVQLGRLEIPDSSSLIFGEDRNGIELNATGILVNGDLIAGSETCRLETPITITLHGRRPGDAVRNVPPEHVKGISVDGGTLSLHGKRYYRTWTRLAQTAEVGDWFLVLQDAVNWESGQEIVLVTTTMKDSREWHQNEVLQIARVVNTSPDLAVGVPKEGAPLGSVTVQVTTPVRYRHAAIDNYQAEVGLLTRTIKIQGAADDSEPTDPDPMNCESDVIPEYLGNRSIPCPNVELTGYGAHVIVHNGGVGKVEGVELFRVGQTNVLGRYPMHFHLLNECPKCYFKDSSVHRSYYRCISIHGTHSTTVTENVAYDVTGFCYYLEDGVETKNTISFNLAAHIHIITPDTPPSGYSQELPIHQQSDKLTLPADVTASGYYITNLDNKIVGNTASGGWAGFAIPTLNKPVGLSRDVKTRPASALGMVFDGNTAHSSGWWWSNAGAIYIGGSLYYDENGIFTYNPGRDLKMGNRDTCRTTPEEGGCPPADHRWIRITNTKVYLTASPGFNSWNGRLELIGFEAHDVGLSLNVLESGFWVDNMLVVCRTGNRMDLPERSKAKKLSGNGFTWYDTGQEHIVTNTTFRNCGYRADDKSRYAEYDNTTSRGCDSDWENGCGDWSTVWGMLSHSDQFNPELMSGSSGIKYENCGRRFRMTDSRNKVSGRLFNWFDTDGSASGLNEPTLIGSGIEDSKAWWKVDERTVYDPQGPLHFIRQKDGPERGLAHIHLAWDNEIHSKVGKDICTNGGSQDCPTLGYIRHIGQRFKKDQGLRVTANADIAGPVGGYGWYLTLTNGAPRRLEITEVEVDPRTPLLLSIAYPPGLSFTITANAPAWCNMLLIYDQNYRCSEQFKQKGSVEEVRKSVGNTYHVSSTGVLTIRIVQTSGEYIGHPKWMKPDWSTRDINGDWYAMDRFERKGVRLPRRSVAQNIDILDLIEVPIGVSLIIETNCCSRNDFVCSITGGMFGVDSVYCPGTRSRGPIDDVCPDGWKQVAYDKCCDRSNMEKCVYANGQRE